jgi:hypothetical protein
VPKNPHRFPQQIESAVPLIREIAVGVQEVITTFLASGGTELFLPEPVRFFEFLTDPGSLEDLNYIP